jgi:(p)ppGpp synthase/HD superfamily hydrolase
MQLSPKFEKALVYATRAHCKQSRKGTETPYVAHILGVAAITLEHGANETEAIAALLHDVVEDCGGAERLRDIKARFGDEVARIVEGCSDTDESPKPPWRQRKEKYIAHLKGAGASIRLVSAADKLHNATAILRDLRQHGDAVWSRFKGGKEGTLWYYGALVTVFRAHDDHRVLVDELQRVVTGFTQIAG